MSQSATHAAQVQFDKIYISSREIVKRLGVTRPTVSQAHKRGLLPPPIVVVESQVYLWERQAIEPALAAWEFMLNSKRAKTK